MLSNEQPASRFWRSHRFWCWVAGVLWVGLSMALFQQGGIRQAPDTSGYIEAARYFLEGSHGTPPPQTLRFGYTLTLAACQKVGVGLGGMVALQLALATLALWCVYDLAKSLAGRSSGLVAVFGAIVWADVHRWHFFILSDSAYISTLAIAIWAVHQAAQRKKWWYAIALLALGATISVRPNSLFLPSLALAYWAALGMPPSARLGRKIGTAAAVMLVVSAACAATPFARRAIEWNAAASNGHSLYRNDGLGGSSDAMFRRGVVIWGQASPLSSAAPYDPVPAQPNWKTAVNYAVRHPGWVLKLATTRILTEAAAVRPFYSPLHNALLIILVTPLWLGAAWGAWHTRQCHGTSWIVLVVALHMALVGATWADYDGRWLSHLVLPLSVLAGCGVTDLLSRKFKVVSQ